MKENSKRDKGKKENTVFITELTTEVKKNSQLLKQYGISPFRFYKTSTPQDSSLGKQGGSKIYPPVPSIAGQHSLHGLGTLCHFRLSSGPSRSGRGQSPGPRVLFHQESRGDGRSV